MFKIDRRGVQKSFSRKLQSFFRITSLQVTKENLFYWQLLFVQCFCVSMLIKAWFKSIFKIESRLHYIDLIAYHRIINVVFIAMSTQWEGGGIFSSFYSWQVDESLLPLTSNGVTSSSLNNKIRHMRILLLCTLLWRRHFP